MISSLREEKEVVWEAFLRWVLNRSLCYLYWIKQLILEMILKFQKNNFIIAWYEFHISTFIDFSCLHGRLKIFHQFLWKKSWNYFLYNVFLFAIMFYFETWSPDKSEKSLLYEVRWFPNLWITKPTLRRKT